jgi:3'-phosphoadenosine 5'-phosphosulfate sulfotransferase (PAPS reductase)/FAD synthetase
MTANLGSFSTGKDSVAIMLYAVEQSAENLSGVFCDTGNEHEAVYEYLEYFQQATGIKIKTLRQDFTAWWWRRRDYVRDKWPEKQVSDQVIQAVLKVFEQGPTGNPFLDLCIIKGRFPSRRAQFCTQYLKSEPATEYAMELIERFGSVVSWQGVRAEESPSRAKLPEREDKGGGYSIFRPIHKWTAAQVFAMHDKHNIKPNPLYKLGMGRVGCMPCVNANKNEILEISKRFPDQIERINEWENAVNLASKRSNATFFPSPGENETARERGNIYQVVQWSQTKRGGTLLDMFRVHDEVLACSSAYGLCE